MIYRSGRPAVALVCLGLLGTDQGLIGWSGTGRWLRHWVKWQTGNRGSVSGSCFGGYAARDIAGTTNAYGECIAL